MGGGEERYESQEAVQGRRPWRRTLNPWLNRAAQPLRRPLVIFANWFRCWIGAFLAGRALPDQLTAHHLHRVARPNPRE